MAEFKDKLGRTEREYVARINRVIDHIQSHLGDDLSLDVLAKVACFSPHHFHRVFRVFTNEPLGQFVRRVRLERAASLLVWAPDRPITEVALDVGFSSPAAFARAFRERFGMSASEWREREQSKDGKAMRERGNAPSHIEMYFEPGAWAPKWRLTMTTGTKDVNVEVKSLPERTVAYLRHTGPYQGNTELFARLFGQLAQWAGPRGLLGPNAQFMSLYHEDPAVTDSDKLRVTVACVVPDDTETDGEIGRMKVAGGEYAVGRFEIDPAEYGEAWDAMYGQWLPKSGYQPDDRPALELYLNDPQTHPEKKHIVEICIPVKPL